MALKLKKEGLNSYLVKTPDLFGKYLANDIINEKNRRSNCRVWR